MSICIWQTKGGAVHSRLKVVMITLDNSHINRMTVQHLDSCLP